ncbi:MAG TPA: PAS domain S-box protein [Terriglobales bacterium]|nr:PAS domain S-box protein [Terriglobales bacterium]
MLIAGWPVAGAAALAALYTRRRQRSAPPSRAERPAPSYETRYRDVIASIDGIVWESDAVTHRTLFISDAVERVLGYSPAQWISDQGLWRRIMYPEDIEGVVSALQSLVERSGDDAADSTEVVYRMFAADGRTVWLQTTIRVIRENGRAILYRGVSLDITQRKLHDLRVAESERFIKTIADNLPALVTYWTRDHRCAFANRSVWDWFDRDPAKLIGIHMRDHLGSDLYEKDLPHVEAVLAGKPQQFERTLTRADGRIIQVVAQYVPDVINGEVVGYFALVSDITTVKARETQLRLLEKSVAQLNDVVMVLVTAPQRVDDLPEDAGTDAVPYAEPRIVYVNDAVERQTGYRVDEVIGATPPFLRDVITPGAETAMLITALRGGKPARAELTCRRKNGHDVNLEIDITPITDESGRVTHTIVIERDITERKQQERENLEAVRRLSESEAFANLVLQSIDAVIIVSDREGNVLRVNRKAELISGYSEADLRNSALAASLVPPDEYPAVKQVLDQTDPALFPITHVNHWIARSGERHLLRWSNVALTDETGEIALRIGIGVDITELRRHEQALIAAKNQAETANRAKSSFLATMSHELRTPLNAIIGFSDLMARQSFGPIGNAKYLDYVNDVLNSGNQLLSIINDILDLSRVEAGKQELKPESLSLADIWPPIANGLSAAAGRKNIRITTPTDLQEVSFLADRRAVMQIVTNLINNSTKFTATGGEIHLHARHSANGAETVISVRDNGRGIPRERIQDVLKPFVQVANTYSRDEGGTGLGLAICNALAGSMQGRIAIDSELGSGTTVFLFLPAPALIETAKSAGRAVEEKIALD